jgi:hypothetical protein
MADPLIPHFAAAAARGDAGAFGALRLAFASAGGQDLFLELISSPDRPTAFAAAYVMCREAAFFVRKLDALPVVLRLLCADHPNRSALALAAATWAQDRDVRQRARDARFPSVFDSIMAGHGADCALLVMAQWSAYLGSSPDDCAAVIRLAANIIAHERDAPRAMQVINNLLEEDESLDRSRALRAFASEREMEVACRLLDRRCAPAVDFLFHMVRAGVCSAALLPALDAFVRSGASADAAPADRLLCETQQMPGARDLFLLHASRIFDRRDCLLHVLPHCPASMFEQYLAGRVAYAAAAGVSQAFIEETTDGFVFRADEERAGVIMKHAARVFDTRDESAIEAFVHIACACMERCETREHAVRIQSMLSGQFGERVPPRAFMRLVEASLALGCPLDMPRLSQWLRRAVRAAADAATARAAISLCARLGIADLSLGDGASMGTYCHLSEQMARAMGSEAAARWASQTRMSIAQRCSCMRGLMRATGRPVLVAEGDRSAVSEALRSAGGDPDARALARFVCELVRATRSADEHDALRFDVLRMVCEWLEAAGAARVRAREAALLLQSYAWLAEMRIARVYVMDRLGDASLRRAQDATRVLLDALCDDDSARDEHVRPMILHYTHEIVHERPDLFNMEIFASIVMYTKPALANPQELHWMVVITNRACKSPGRCRALCSVSIFAQAILAVAEHCNTARLDDEVVAACSR